MSEHVRIERRDRLFHVDIRMPLEPAKAKTISEAIENEAGEATVDVISRRRLHELTANGLVRPATMRQILAELAR